MAEAGEADERAPGTDLGERPPATGPSGGAYRDGKPLDALIPPDRRRRNAIVLASVSMVAGAVLAALAQQLHAAYALRDRDGVVTPTPVAVPVLSGLTIGRPRAWEDRTSRSDGSIRPDGEVDLELEVVVDGAVKALALVDTDSGGQPRGLQQWDTIVGDQAVPPEMTRGHTTGSATMQLGVFKDGATMQLASGALLPLPEGRRHTLQLFASDIGRFAAGAHFCVMGVLADGSVVKSEVVTYPAGQDFPTEPPAVPDERPAAGTFDRAAAAAALGRVQLASCQSRIANAAPARAQPTGHVKVTFAPDGTVMWAVVDEGPLARGPGGGCVAAQFKKITVPPFTGGPVTMGKSFTFERVDPSEMR